MRDVVLYATDTMADWEYSYLTTGLTMAEEQAPGRYRLVVAADDAGRPVTTKGGLRIAADVAMTDVEPESLAALILPGADTWESGHAAALDLAARLLSAPAAGGEPALVAAICGATLGLARAGLLDQRAHTSNAPEFLAGVTGYRGADHYRDERAVADGNLITATATAPIDFARLVFERLELFPPPVIGAWYGLYTTGEKRFYDQLVGAAG